MGTSFKQLDGRLEAAIATRYGLRAWTEHDYERHKRADRLAAASEALHVPGWSRAEISETLLIPVCPLSEDPMPAPDGMKPWEPWPAQLAASLFLAKLRELSARGESPRTPGDLSAGVERERVLRHLADTFSRLPAKTRGKCPVPPVGCGLRDTMVYVEAHDGSQSVEGVVVGGERDQEGGWDFDAPFRIFTTDEELLLGHGYNCHVEIQ